MPSCCEHCNELVPQNPYNLLTASFSGRLLPVQFAVTSDSRSGESEWHYQHTTHLPTVGKAVCCPPFLQHYATCRKTLPEHQASPQEVTSLLRTRHFYQELRGVAGAGRRRPRGAAETKGGGKTVEKINILKEKPCIFLPPTNFQFNSIQ